MKPELTLADLEKRMRPRGYSSAGFLGPNEPLEAVMSQDEQTLLKLGISYDQLADGLAEILENVMQQLSALLVENQDEFLRRTLSKFWDGDLPMRQTAVENLPSQEIGSVVRDQFQVFLIQYRGLQDCPWGCDYDPWAYLDFLLINLKTHQMVAGPGLIVHLIRDHHFFEGLESPYRVEPLRLAKVLGLVPGASQE